MLNISGLKEGIVLDHIEAGKSLDIYYHLGLDKLDCQVAIIKNARSNKMGRKDIIKIEGGLDKLDLDILGYIDHNITVNIIRDDRIAEKKALKLPKKITNVIHCKNPRCITSIEQELPHIFYLADEKTETYRCQYCEEKYSEYAPSSWTQPVKKPAPRFKAEAGFLFPSLFVFRNNLNPVSIRIGNEINSHSRIFIADAAHFFMLFVDAFVVIYMKSQVELAFTQVIRLCTVF